MTTICLSGLDLAFLKNSPPIRRKKKRFSHPVARSDLGGPMVISDIKPFMANAHAGDPVEITSRSQLARYERANNVRQAGDFKPGELVAKEKKRVAATRHLANAKDFNWA